MRLFKCYFYFQRIQHVQGAAEGRRVHVLREALHDLHAAVQHPRHGVRVAAARRQALLLPPGRRLLERDRDHAAPAAHLVASPRLSRAPLPQRHVQRPQHRPHVPRPRRARDPPKDRHRQGAVLRQEDLPAAQARQLPSVLHSARQRHGQRRVHFDPWRHGVRYVKYRLTNC